MARTTRRRVLITLQPGDGHLPPLLPLSRALRAAGHEVVFAAAAVAERGGLPLATFGLPPGQDPDWFLGQLQIGTFPAGYGHAVEPHGQRVSIDAHTAGSGDETRARCRPRLCVTTASGSRTARHCGSAGGGNRKLCTVTASGTRGHVPDDVDCCWARPVPRPAPCDAAEDLSPPIVQEE